MYTMTETDFYFILFMSNASYNGEGNNIWNFAVEWFDYLFL